MKSPKPDMKSKKTITNGKNKTVMQGQKNQ